ncbi:MAG: carbohydrate binding domain-containing protein [Bryobacteraceae bacterium]|nr:carbohydrate binding domain-containing protein [Bryobacteraceae bacterium]
MFRSAIPVLAAIFSVCAMSPPARADMIVNGDFSTGDLTGWTRGGNTYASGISNMFHSGPYGYEMGPPTTAGFLAQTIATTPGDTYNFSFWVKNASGGVNQFTAYWDDIPVLQFINADRFYFTRYSFQMTALDSSTDIRFVYRHDTDFYGLDDVSVVHAPEPSSLALVILAAGGVWLIKRKRMI